MLLTYRGGKAVGAQAFVCSGFVKIVKGEGDSSVTCNRSIVRSILNRFFRLWNEDNWGDLPRLGKACKMNRDVRAKPRFSKFPVHVYFCETCNRCIPYALLKLNETGNQNPIWNYMYTVISFQFWSDTDSLNFKHECIVEGYHHVAWCASEEVVSSRYAGTDKVKRAGLKCNKKMIP